MANNASNEADELTALSDMVEFMASSLLKEGTEIKIDSKQSGNQWRIELWVPDDVRGRVIGRGGRIARAMRTLLNNTGIPTHRSVILDIVD